MGEFKSLNRRDFLRRVALGGAALTAFSMLPNKLFAEDTEEYTKLTILHTNDQHSRIDPFPMSDPKYPGLGGFSRRASLIKRIRNEENNVLLFDAGDIWQGTPYFNLYGGELEFKLMSEMKYDGATIGNHDLDNGIDGLVKQLPHAAFPFINCNYDFKDTALDGKTIPYKIFEKENLKIGVFGLGIECKGLIDEKNYGNIIYRNPIEKAAEYSHLLKHDLNCDLIICLSHLGDRYETNKVSDCAIAKQSKNIDLFIGGHTHRFLESPIKIYNSDEKEVFVVQTGFSGIKLGRVDYYFHRGNKKKSAKGTLIHISDKQQ